jgi:hypothetical protein
VIKVLVKGFQWDMPELSNFVHGSCNCFILGNGISKANMVAEKKGKGNVRSMKVRYQYMKFFAISAVLDFFENWLTENIICVRPGT